MKYTDFEKKHLVNKTLDEIDGKYSITYDVHGFAETIKKGKITVLHLNAGTLRNCEFVVPLVIRLNAQMAQIEARTGVDGVSGG
jgi:hypothetical protein